MTAGAHAAGLARAHVREKPGMVLHVGPDRPGGAVALHAVFVLEGARDVDLLENLFVVVPHPLRDELVDVTHASELGHRVSEHAVVLVTDVATTSPELVGAGMDGGERIALGVVGVLDPHIHRVAASTEALLLRGSQAFHVADHGDRDRQHAHPKQHHGLAGCIERRSSHEVVDHDARRDERTSRSLRECEPGSPRAPCSAPSSSCSQRILRGDYSRTHVSFVPPP